MIVPLVGASLLSPASQKNRNTPSMSDVAAGSGPVSSAGHHNNREKNKDKYISNDNNDKELPSDSASSSSSEDEEEDTSPGLSFMEIRAKKIARNQSYLQELGLLPPKPQSETTDDSNHDDRDDDKDNDYPLPYHERQGILLPSDDDEYAVNVADSSRAEEDSLTRYQQGVQQLQYQFPGRGQQIQQLSSLLMSISDGTTTTRGDNNGESFGMGARGTPIVVTGAAGTGKTSLVQAICKGNRNGNNIYTYLDLSTCQETWVHQIRSSVLEQTSCVESHSTSRRRKKKREKQEGDMSHLLQRPNRKKRRKTSQENGLSKGAQKVNGVGNASNHPVPNLRRSQRSSTVDNTAQSNQNAEGDRATAQDMKLTTQGNNGGVVSFGASSSEGVSTQQRGPLTVHHLGQFLQQHLTIHHEIPARDKTSSNDNTSTRSSTSQRPLCRPMILVLDRAELLLSNGSSSQAQTPQPNVLAQLLLLPRTISGLECLTIVVITRSLLLMRARVNTMVDPGRSLTSIMGMVQPLQVHFPAYRGTAILEKIFQTSRVARMVTGESHWVPSEVLSEQSSNVASEFPQKLYRSFVHAFVTMLYDTCKDMNELIRMGRLLWPIYIQPLSSENGSKSIEQAVDSALKTLHQPAGANEEHGEGTTTTIALATTEATDKAVLEYLNRKALSEFRRVQDTCYGTLACVPPLPVTCDNRKHKTTRKLPPEVVLQQQREQNPLNRLPRQLRYLLLAAYLCQVNRPDQDRSLFSIQKNGRRSKKKDTATAREQQSSNNNSRDRISSFRLRSFPLERMLSVYVSLVGLHETSIPGGNGNDRNTHNTRTLDPLASLQERVGEWLQQLLFLQWLQLSSSQDGSLRLSDSRYICQITLYQAQTVARSLDFPLDRYVL